MPPQQPYGLLAGIDQRFDFGAHGGFRRKGAGVFGRATV
jgi:hypothetical protein